MDEQATVRSGFAARFYDKVASTHTGKNLFVSPFSVQVALAMCAVGAKGETRQKLIDLIGAPESVDEQNEQFSRLLQSVYGNGKRPFELVTANALWGQKGYRFNSAFQQAIANFYDGALHEVDFCAKPDEAVKIINSWVSRKTRTRIKGLVDRQLIDADTPLVLINAIYFRGRWEQVFDNADTRNEDWYGPKKARVPMMHQRGSYLYYEEDGFQVVHLPYKGRQLAMLIVLPRRIDGLAALESRWAKPQTFRQVTDGLDPETVIFSLPRFTIEAECKLRPVLSALHADLAFSDDADFSGIGDGPLKISEILHKAALEVNEEGTEATAATAVRMVLSTGAGSRPPEPKVFKADHPFLFIILDRKTNTVFFSGRLVDPR
jgi:serpin B